MFKELRQSAVLKAYGHPVMRQVFLNGIISGLPWVIFGSVLTLWLASAGHSRSAIGAFGWIGLAYSLNLIWAPIMDRGALPALAKLGSRRSWIFSMQCCILLCLAGIMLVDIQQHIVLLTILMVIAAFAGATQDVAIDALRIEQTRAVSPAAVVAGAAATTIGWWTGYGLGGALVIGSLHWLETGFPDYQWQLGYMCIFVLVALCLSALWWVQKIYPEPDRPAPERLKFSADFLLRLYLDPIQSFLKNYGAKLGIALLTAIILFKLGEAFLGRMSLVFYNENFSKADIALYSKGFGTVAYCIFAFIGSLLSVRYGLLRGLLIGGVLMSSTNLLFALLAHFPDRALFGFAVVADQFTTAISTIVFVAFISQLCNKRHTATHYAALASLGNFSRVSLAGFSGVMVDGLGGNWALFFVITALMVLPSLALLWFMRTPISRALSSSK
jgi:PAT family beta-lactamase induction signal transducer AmpG